MSLGFIQALRRLLPFSLRVRIMRWRQGPATRSRLAQQALPKGKAEDFPFVFVEKRSPLHREGSAYSSELQAGKETNVGLAAALADLTLLQPGEVFSYHAQVGEPSIRRGFRKGPELHDGRLEVGIGGGCCQASNMLYLLALLSGAEILERHRHGYDLFPDSGRSVPFGCGATIFYPHRDLKFRNQLSTPLMFSLRIEEGCLVGRVLAPVDPGITFEIFEISGSIAQVGSEWHRENEIGRRTRGGSQDGKVEVVAHNKAVCLYRPEDQP